MAPKTTPLRRLRESRKLTLQEVADAIKTDTGNLSRIEQGKQRSLDMATKLVEFYEDGITETEILYPFRDPPKAGKKRADVAEPRRER